MRRFGRFSPVRIAVYLVVWCLLGLFLVRALDRLPDAAEWRRLIAAGGGAAFAVFAACFLAALALRLWRFGFLTRLSMPVPWRRLTLGFPWLFMLGAITPFRLGEGMRAYWLHAQGGSASVGVGNWAAERWTDLLVLIACLTVGLTFATVEGIGQAALWALAAGLAAGYLMLWRARPALRRLCTHLPAGREAAAVIIDSFAYLSNPTLHLTVVATTIAIWSVMALGFWSALSVMLGHPVSVAMSVCCLGAVNLIALVSATPGNVLSFQAAMIAVMAAWGYGTVEALMVSVIIQSSGLLVAILCGLAARLLDYVDTAWTGSNGQARRG